MLESWQKIPNNAPDMRTIKPSRFEKKKLIIIRKRRTKRVIFE